ncbi:MAG: hypothetical protein K2N50_05795 [Clostridia bacterium]|nr:hypothetical protein [Clostridia bacterium]MDE7257449.1 hypothetical protein [Clostridia bacterium]
MNSVIEEIYDEIFKNIDNYADNKECAVCDKETSELLKEFKQYVPLAQFDLFDKLWRSVLNCNCTYGRSQFKGGFKMGFRLACECLKG